jgi:hypothetical protein
MKVELLWRLIPVKVREPTEPKEQRVL